jgi:hypothetical protein
MSFASAPLAALAVMLASGSAHAQSDAENRATARALAQQGGEALEARDYPKAEDAFRRANALFHAPTLLLGMARAQTAEGKFVEAWENYNQIILEGVATTPIFAKALDDAKKEIASVDGRRSRVTVTVTGAGSSRVTLDEGPLKVEALGVPLFVNPGTHTVAATADGFKPSTQTFAVAEGQSAAVILALEPMPAAAPPAPALIAPAPPPRAGRVNHVPAYIAFGAGGLGLVVGVVEGLAASSKHSTLKGECPTSTTCPSTAQATIDAYHSAGAISTFGFVLAGVGAAVGVTLWIVENKSAAHDTASISPYIGLGSIGAIGRF